MLSSIAEISFAKTHRDAQIRWPEKSVQKTLWWRRYPFNATTAFYTTTVAPIFWALVYCCVISRFNSGSSSLNDLTRHINDYLLDLSGEGGSGFVFLEGINISPYLDNMVG
jgi:hypothetical protein